MADAENGTTPITAAGPLFSMADLIIVEGHKEEEGLKIEVIGHSEEPPLFASGVPGVTAVVCDHDVPTALPRFRRDAVDEIAEFIDRLLEKRFPGCQEFDRR